MLIATTLGICMSIVFHIYRRAMRAVNSLLHPSFSDILLIIRA